MLSSFLTFLGSGGWIRTNDLWNRKSHHPLLDRISKFAKSKRLQAFGGVDKGITPTSMLKHCLDTPRVSSGRIEMC